MLETHHAGLMRAALAAFAVLAACQNPSKPAERSATTVRKVRATVVTIQTTMPPSPKSWTHTIVIGNDRARSSDELEEWRLFDFKEKRVTYVDDLARTYRNMSFEEALATHRATLARPLPDGMPHAQFAAGGPQKVLQGVPARQSVIRLGAYQRDLWIAAHPLIPPELFAMIQASETSSSPFAGVMRQVDDALLNVRGYPMVDHAELPYEKGKLVVDSTVVSIDQRDVPADTLDVNGAYKEVKLAPEAAKPTPRGK